MSDRNDKQSVRIVIPGIPPSLNEALRLHRTKLKTIRDCWRKDIHHITPNRDRSWLESMANLKKRMAVRIIVRHKHPDDPDNLWFRAKYILDVMKPTKLNKKGMKAISTGLSFIADDSEQFIDLRVEQEVLHGVTETVIAISEAGA